MLKFCVTMSGSPVLSFSCFQTTLPLPGLQAMSGRGHGVGAKQGPLLATSRVSGLEGLPLPAPWDLRSCTWEASRRGVVSEKPGA